jgi:hypothetical protein
MNEDLGGFVVEEVKRLGRRASRAILLAMVGTAGAVTALVAPYNPALRAYVERLVGAKPRNASVVEAERFVVRDKAGQVRAELGVDPDDNSAQISLRGPDGKLRVLVAATDDPNAGMAALTLNSGDGATFITLWVSDSFSRIQLREEGGRNAGLSYVKGSSPRFYLNDKDNNTRLQLDITDDGPALTLLDHDGHDRARLGSTEIEGERTGNTERTAESSLLLFDKEGQVIFQAPHP